jgi:hypothetical protein
MKKLLSLFLFIGLCLSAIFPQAQKLPTGGAIDEGLTIFDLRQYEGWQKIELGWFSFYLPKEVKRVESGKRCWDSTCQSFESTEFVMKIDDSFDVRYPRYQRRFESYKDKTFRIGKAHAWLLFFQRADKPKKYEAGILFQPEEENGQRLKFTFLSDRADIMKTAEKIAISVHFKKRD